MNTLNRTEIIGNLVRDAELKTVNIEGVPTPRCIFSVAVNDERANGEPITTYFDVTIWRDYATKTAPWLTRGRKVYVCGKVRINQYTANQTIRTSMQLHNAEVILLDKKPEVDVQHLEEFDDDELPFIG